MSVDVLTPDEVAAILKVPRKTVVALAARFALWQLELYRTAAASQEDS